MPSQSWVQNLIEAQAQATFFNSFTTAKTVLNPQSLLILPAGFFDRVGKAIRVTADYPGDVAASDIVLQGRAKSIWRPENNSDIQLNLRYGIESYFVPEGTGKALETKVREHKIEAIVAVDASGSAALKGLVVDGERHVDPPLL